MKPERTGRRRGGPLVRQVLEAALAEMARAGIGNLSVERVAATAGVNKTTIYRRWPTIDALAMAALDLVSDAAPVPDTGDLRSDLIESLQRSYAVARNPAVLALLRLRLASGGGEPMGGLIAARLEQGDAATMSIFVKARQRGELPAEADIALFCRVFVGAGQQAMLTGEGPRIDPAALTDLLMHGFTGR